MVYRYSAHVLRGDYFRTLAGLLLFGAIALVNTDRPWALMISGSLTLLFLLYGIRTFWRQGLTLSVDPEGLTLRQSWPCLMHEQKMAWPDVRTVKLRYYASRRKKTLRPEEGLITLAIRGAKARIHLESSLNGFIELALTVARQSEEYRQILDSVTLENFTALGYRTPDAERGAAIDSAGSPPLR